MKKFALVLFLACTAAGLWPAASLAGVSVRRALQPLASLPARPANGVHFTLPQALREAAQPCGLRTPARGIHTTTARTSSGPCEVTGKVLDYGGLGVAGAEVDLYYADAAGDSYFFGAVSSTSDGSFAFSGVPETTGGELDVFFDNGDGYQSWGNSFTAGWSNYFPLQPGLVDAQVSRTSDSSWNWWTWFRVETYGSGGGGTTWINGDEGGSYAMEPDCDYAVAYPYDNQGIEWSTGSPATVTAGAFNGDVLTFDQNEGRGAWIHAPYWDSGKAGTRTTLVLENWPAGYQMSFYGYSQAPSGRFKDWPFYVESDGSTYNRMKLTIPSTAPAGYDYEVHVYRYDDKASDLDLTVYFQVASLKTSHAKIGRGGSVKLSGVVPTQGHMGSTSGKSKYVTLYQRTKSAGPPTTWDATRKGWHKVGTIMANGRGAYHSRLLHPKRTTWYVVRYPGDDWYSRAYTSVTKVTVR
jgi:hypothetical protein